MREKLIELLLNMPGYLLGAEGLADHLIANGVTIPARCKDCKHYDKDALWCNINSYQFGEQNPNWYEDDFCSYGERREGE